MKIILTAAALCLGIMSASAQSDKVQDAGASKDCLSSTTDKDWSSLGLTKDQTAQVKAVQADWRKEEGSKTMDSKTGTKESPMANSYEAKVQSVLSPEQYENWLKWCSTHANTGVKKASGVTTDEDMSE